MIKIDVKKLTEEQQYYYNRGCVDTFAPIMRIPGLPKMAKSKYNEFCRLIEEYERASSL